MATEVCIVTFPTTHAALRGEKAAKQSGHDVKMAPVPRGISSDCNMGMRAAVEDMEQLRTLLASKQIECSLVRWQDP